MTLVAACGKASFSVCFVSGTAFGLICSSRSYGPAKSLSPMMDRTLALSKSAGSTQENVPRYGSQSPSIPHAGVPQAVKAGKKSAAHLRQILAGVSHGACRTPQVKLNCRAPLRTPGMGFPVGLKGRIAVVAPVGFPAGPKDA